MTASTETPREKEKFPHSPPFLPQCVERVQLVAQACINELIPVQQRSLAAAAATAAAAVAAAASPAVVAAVAVLREARQQLDASSVEFEAAAARVQACRDPADLPSHVAVLESLAAAAAALHGRCSALVAEAHTIFERECLNQFHVAVAAARERTAAAAQAAQRGAAAAHDRIAAAAAASRVDLVAHFTAVHDARSAELRQETRCLRETAQALAGQRGETRQSHAAAALEMWAAEHATYVELKDMLASRIQALRWELALARGEATGAAAAAAYQLRVLGTQREGTRATVLDQRCKLGNLNDRLAELRAARSRGATAAAAEVKRLEREAADAEAAIQAAMDAHNRRVLTDNAEFRELVATKLEVAAGLAARHGRARALMRDWARVNDCDFSFEYPQHPAITDDATRPEFWRQPVAAALETDQKRQELGDLEAVMRAEASVV